MIFCPYCFYLKMKRAGIVFLFICGFLVAISRTLAYRTNSGNYRTTSPDSDRSSQQDYSLRSNINYKLQNNYELYIDRDGKLNQHKESVRHARILLKNGNQSYRFTLNDMEVMMGVYPINPKDKEKILRQTLKEPSLCYLLAGLLMPHLDNIRIDNGAIYGFIIRGSRNVNNVASDTLDVDVIVANVPISLGSFRFKGNKQMPYPVPFLVSHYQHLTGNMNRNYQYICRMPDVLLDVLYTTKSGVKITFNGQKYPANTFYPYGITSFLENPNNRPVQTRIPPSDKVNFQLREAEQAASDVAIRTLTASGARGTLFRKVDERLMSHVSFQNVKSGLRAFLRNDSNKSLEPTVGVFFFLALAQNLTKGKVSQNSVLGIRKIEVTNITPNSSGSLGGFVLKLYTSKSVISINAKIIGNKRIPLPTNIKANGLMMYVIPYTYGLQLRGTGPVFSVLGSTITFSNAFDYKLNSLASSVKAI